MYNKTIQSTKAIALSRFSNYILISFILGSVLFYIYLANSAVRTLTVLSKTKESMQSLSTEVSELESKRFSIDNNVNSDLASNFGFVEVKSPVFIMKNNPVSVLSLNTP